MYKNINYITFMYNLLNTIYKLSLTKIKKKYLKQSFSKNVFPVLATAQSILLNVRNLENYI